MFTLPEVLFSFLFLILALLLLYFFSGPKEPIEDFEEDSYPLEPGDRDFSAT